MHLVLWAHSRGIEPQCVKLTTHLSVLLRLRICGALLTFPYTSMCGIMHHASSLFIVGYMLTEKSMRCYNLILDVSDKKIKHNITQQGVTHVNITSNEPLEMYV